MKFRRRDFLKVSGATAAAGIPLTGCGNDRQVTGRTARPFNGSYTKTHLNRVAFPLGGIGAGMLCLEGTGAFSHFSLRNNPAIFNEPMTFAALCVKGRPKGAKVLEGPVPGWKIFGSRGTGNGAAGTSYGFPRFQGVRFEARFPFATASLEDPDLPLQVDITGWSPFIPLNADDSSLPVAAVEYRFRNDSTESLSAVFSYHARNFMATRDGRDAILPHPGGFRLHQPGSDEKPYDQGDFIARTDDESTVVDHCWFRGGWWDPLTITWETVQEGRTRASEPIGGAAPGASLYVPFELDSNGEKTIRLLLSWYVPETNLRLGQDPSGTPEPAGCADDVCCPDRRFHVPWYAGRFRDAGEVAGYWAAEYERLKAATTTFTSAFFDSTLPAEVLEAAAANLTILKSPTVRRQCDGKLWCFEGCGDDSGCCHGSCTHVWNYAQAVPHLFPELERSLRETEYLVSQDERGHQAFRSALPVRPVRHDFHAASDGQLGGVMKVHREWRISGDTVWLRRLWPRVRQSLDYCIESWDPRRRGVLEEPHHNTYDIEFWGPDSMCTSFYLGALTAAVAMGEALGENVATYRELLEAGKRVLEGELFNGEYFHQKVVWTGLNAPDPAEAAEGVWNTDYSDEALQLLQEEGPKYQYGTGCLSDAVLGFWLARMCGLGKIADAEKVRSTLKSIHLHNLKPDLTDHVNPQRPAYAVGGEGGLLLCSWPRGGQPSLPFVYSNEVWTGIEYQVASHLILEGFVEEGLEIVRICRSRYDGAIRNPFNEYECGHWYARAMASYGLLQALTGARYDAVTKVLTIDSRIGDSFRSFLSTETGFGVVGLRNGEPFYEDRAGRLDIERFEVL